LFEPGRNEPKQYERYSTKSGNGQLHKLAEEVEPSEQENTVDSDRDRYQKGHRRETSR
jgi:hypothetical protein